MSLIHQPTRRDLLRYAAGAGVLAARREAKAAPYAWSFVAQSSAADTAVGSTKAFTGLSAGANGNMLIGFIANLATTATRTVSSISQTNVDWGGGLSSQRGFGANPIAKNVSIWMGIISGGSAGTTATVTFSGSCTSGVMVLLEVTGGKLSDAIGDGDGQGHGTGTSVNSNSDLQCTLDYFNDLIVACVAFGSGTGPSANPGGAYSDLTLKTNGLSTLGIQANYVARSTTRGNQSPTWAFAGSTVWGSCAAGVSATASYGAQSGVQ